MRCLMPPVELAPVGGGDHARDDVEGQDAVDGGAVAVDREGDAKGKKLALGISGPFAELAQLKQLEAPPKRGEVRVGMFRRALQLAIVPARIVTVEGLWGRRFF